MVRDRFAGVQRVVQRSVDRGDFPSACLLVAHEGQIALHRAFGQPGRLDTVYDLASLTKVLATTAVAMRLCADGRIDPDDTVERWVPTMQRRETRDMRLSHLLAHCSGLPAWLPLHALPEVRRAAPARRRQVVRRVVARTPLETPVGRATLYSDLGFMLLAWALERAGGARLDRLARELVFAPLGLRRTVFIPVYSRGRVAELRRRWPFAPTERCPWRRRRLVAEVHDDNCHAMGGVAGHAGLFSTAHEVYLVARELLAAQRGDRSLFQPDVVRRFFRTRPRRDATRVLGWDTPASSGSSAGRHFGPRSVGHLGFTGTSLWIERQREVIVVLLTNRVYHGREPNPMPALRPRLHDAVMAALGLDGR